MDVTISMQAPVSSVKGVGAKTEQLFQKIGVYTIGDILLRFPREYTKFPEPVEASNISIGQRQAVVLRVEEPAMVKYTRSMPVTICYGRHMDAQIEFLWFRMPYVKNTLKKGQTFILYGMVQDKICQP